LLKSGPALQFSEARWRVATYNTPHFLLHSREGHWILDDLIVVLQGAGRQIEEWLKYLQVGPWILIIDQLPNDLILCLLEGLSRKVWAIIRLL
jgi:hypothetical protein